MVVRGENVLSRESMLSSLAFQRTLRENDSIAPALADEHPVVGVENVLATRLIRERRTGEAHAGAADSRRRAIELNATAAGLEAALNETRAIQREYESLDGSYEQGEITPANYTFRSQKLESRFDRVFENATADLEGNETARFERAVASARSLERDLVAAERAVECGDLTESEYQSRVERLRRDEAAVYENGTVGVLGADPERLRADGASIEGDIQFGPLERPPLEAQIAALEPLNASEHEAAVAALLADGGPGSKAALDLLPASYEPGTTSAESRTILVT